MGFNNLDSSGLEKGLLEFSCEHSNEPLGSIKCREVLEEQNDSSKTQFYGVSELVILWIPS
jgi:hypothetical protein